jgi:hypothetical protein
LKFDREFAPLFVAEVQNPLWGNQTVLNTNEDAEEAILRSRASVPFVSFRFLSVAVRLCFSRELRERKRPSRAKQFSRQRNGLSNQSALIPGRHSFAGLDWRGGSWCGIETAAENSVKKLSNAQSSVSPVMRQVVNFARPVQFGSQGLHSVGQIDCNSE